MSEPRIVTPQEAQDGYDAETGSFSVGDLTYTVATESERIEAAISEAREQGRQEVRDAVNALFDIYSPHAVSWWNEMNKITKPDFRDTTMK